MQEQVSAQRVHIAFFGRRNVGKSSLINAVTGQKLSVVSEVKGTTTDPVKKAMELLPIGPVVVIDTPGFDDEGPLGELRVEKTKEILRQTEVAVLVVDAVAGWSPEEEAFLKVLEKKEVPYILVYNKADLLEDEKKDPSAVYVSATKGNGIENLKQVLGELAKKKETDKRIVSDLLSKGDVVLLVTPIDESAPKGRLILPQQQTIRDILDAGAMPLVCRDTELKDALGSLGAPPKMVITDSQAFGRVSKIVPESIPLTSFSILFARYKGDLKTQVQGAAMLSKLKEGDRILIAEGCTHHRQCGDIGTVKLPAWIRAFSEADVKMEFMSGGEFPVDLSAYKLVVHCGGCMLNETEMKNRIKAAKEQHVPVVNYGVAIAHIHGILKRSLELFPDVLELL